jgi:rhodanese-related sulfurtransferase
MSTFQWALLALTGALLLWMLLKRRGDVSPDEARAMLDDGGLLLDVRSAAEFSTGHLPGAENVPLGDLGKKLLKLGPKTRPIVVYCLSGARSGVAASMLKRAGFERVRNLGAMSRW